MDINKAFLKKRWTLDQDNALQQIKENLRYKSWSLIAKKMSTDFGFYGRSQKQCRDRYQNYLKGKDTEFQWTSAQEYKMFKMFAKQGSKWQLIASYFKNIKGIHIKNKFYTRVRKAIRQVNSMINFYYSKKYVPFSFSVISKLVALISKNVEELKYQKSDKDQFQTNDKFSYVLFQLIELTNQDNQEMFPELNIKQKSPIQKRKLFKKLIKNLKKIELQKFKLQQNDINGDYQSNMLVKSIQNSKNENISQIRDDRIKVLDKILKNHCSYKIISNYHERVKTNFRIISRIKKIKIKLKIPKQESKFNSNQAELFGKNTIKQQQQNQDFCMENIQNNILQLAKFNNYYVLCQEPNIYFDLMKQISNIQLFYNFQ